MVTLGHAWEFADEKKMRQTFDWGRSDFNKFVDLQCVADDLGYGRDQSLGSLTERVTGTVLPKDINIRRSDWEARQLKKAQVLYAALDVFAAGQVFRQLRVWHANPGLACSACKKVLGELHSHQTNVVKCILFQLRILGSLLVLQDVGVWPVGHHQTDDFERLLGEPLMPNKICCAEEGCSRTFKTAQGYREHARSQGHKFIDPECSGCGRLLPYSPYGSQMPEAYADTG